MIDRRQYERVELSAPCRVSAAWIGQSPCDGVTENLSRNGLLVRINGISNNNLPRVGDFVAVDILLSGLQAFGQKSLRCRGSVVWVLAAERNVRMALAVQHMTFRTVGEGRRRKVAQAASWDEILFRA